MKVGVSTSLLDHPFRQGDVGLWEPFVAKTLVVRRDQVLADLPDIVAHSRVWGRSNHPDQCQRRVSRFQTRLDVRAQDLPTFVVVVLLSLSPFDFTFGSTFEQYDRHTTR